MAQGRRHVIDANAAVEAQLARRDRSVAQCFGVVHPLVLMFYLWGRNFGRDMAAAKPGVDGASGLGPGAACRAARAEAEGSGLNGCASATTEA